MAGHRRLPTRTRGPAADVAKDCRHWIGEKCREKGWAILDRAIQPGHVHLFVRVWPGDSAAAVIKECKGITPFHLRKKHKHLLKLPSLWTRSYFTAAAGNVSAETIRRSIEAQKGV
jgi:putative transposase